MAAFKMFVSEVNAAYDEGWSEERLMFRVTQAVEKLVVDETFLDDFGLPIPSEYQTYLLYQDPARRWIVTASTSRDGLYRPPHDHGPTWAVYGVYSGEIQMNRYRRVDDRRTEGYAELETVAEFVARPGMVDPIVPGGIHELRYFGDAGISVIARSADHTRLVRGRYYPLEKRVEIIDGGATSTGSREEKVDLRHLAERVLR